MINSKAKYKRKNMTHKFQAMMLLGIRKYIPQKYMPINPEPGDPKIINVSLQQLTEFVVPEFTDKPNLDCSVNHLSSLTVPEGYLELSCYQNNLTELNLPSTLTYLECDTNQLRSLELPTGVKTLFCYNNKIERLVLPSGCETVYCDQNKLKELELPDSVNNLCCHNNEIEFLRLPSYGLFHIDLMVIDMTKCNECEITMII